MKKSIILLFFFFFVTNINAQNVTFITITGTCDSEFHGWYDYNGLINGKPSYFLDAPTYGPTTIYWDNTQWVLETIGVIAMTNSSNSSYPPIGYGNSWTSGVWCNPGEFGIWGGSTAFVQILNSCDAEFNGFYIYTSDINGKPSYYREADTYGPTTIYWDNTQWVIEAVGVIAMTNSSNSIEPPTCDSSWGGVWCNPGEFGDFIGPDCYLILDNSCESSLDGYYDYNGITNGKRSYSRDSGGGNWGPVTIYWDNTQWVLEAADVILMTNNTDSPSPEIGTWGGILCNPGEFGDFIGPNTQLVLPVELLSFTGMRWDNQINLDWQTALELNNEKFEVEESEDGRNFQRIGVVEGKGTTNEQQDYLFEVENPRIGVSYFRLKQIDFDGQFEYSKVISVNFKGDNGELGQFYPNPSKSGLVNLDYISKNNDEITVSVFDMTGKLVVNQFQSILKGDNNLSFDFSDLNTGIYIVKIGDEISSTHRKLIIEN